jgi:hypothetical protein
MPLELIDPATAIIAVHLLSSFLSSASDGFAKKAGEKLLEKTGEIYSTVKEAFTAGEYGALTLLRLSEAPEEERRQNALSDALIEKMQAEPEFAKDLKRLVDEARAADTNGLIVKGDRNVTIGGNVSQTTINTGDINAWRNSDSGHDREPK